VKTQGKETPAAPKKAEADTTVWPAPGSTRRASGGGDAEAECVAVAEAEKEASSDAEGEREALGVQEAEADGDGDGDANAIVDVGYRRGQRLIFSLHLQ